MLSIPFNLISFLPSKAIHVKLILTSLFSARSMMLNTKCLNERALTYWTNLRRDIKANVFESYIIKGPPNLKRFVADWRVSLPRHAPVSWNFVKHKALKGLNKFILEYKVLKLLFSRDKIFLVFDAVFAAKLTKLCQHTVNHLMTATVITFCITNASKIRLWARDF